ncbi:hypothetical protein AB0L40_00080 [Patulibacter sp. NPDC049589]|uniref:hypothetical protein n=1 Tax=Patulibacter sp. NPDC049589 TaxID=3154731 RepID=UPI003438D867
MQWRTLTRRSTAVALATGGLLGLGASGALAATGSTVYGGGSTFQTNAQNTIWLPSWTSALSPKPTIKYGAGGSGTRAAFGTTNGVLDPTFNNASNPDKPTDTLYGYIGTDAAPNTTALGLARNASGNVRLLTIPVAQAPVTALVSLPADCAVTGAVNLPNSVLSKAFAGTYTTWTDLLSGAGITPTGAGCGVAVKRVVRSNTSGTSFAFRNFLNQVDTATWASFANDGTSWPGPADTVSADGSTALSSGSLLSGYVKKTPGTIGFADLSDAVAGGYTATATLQAATSNRIAFASLQNNGTTVAGATFASPQAASATTGNCATDVGSLPRWQGAPDSGTADWSNVLASDPNVKGFTGQNFYPACAVTYDLAWADYTTGNLAAAYTKNGATAAGVQATVKDYLGYVTSDAGQTAINTASYTKLPAQIAKTAQSAVAGIGGPVVVPPVDTPVDPPVVTPPVVTPPVVTPPVVTPPVVAPKVAKFALSVAKPKSVKRGASLSFKVTVRNSGAGASAASVLTVTPPKGVRVGSGKAGKAVKIKIAAIKAGGSKVITVKLKTAKSTKKSTKVTLGLAGGGLKASGSLALKLK